MHKHLCVTKTTARETQLIYLVLDLAMVDVFLITRMYRQNLFQFQVKQKPTYMICLDCVRGEN